jgi:hypothetical protein
VAESNIVPGGAGPTGAEPPGTRLNWVTFAARGNVSTFEKNSARVKYRPWIVTVTGIVATPLTDVTVGSPNCALT